MDVDDVMCSTCMYRHQDNYCILNGMDINYAVKTDKKGIFCPLDKEENKDD